jgi:hypothetical protein
MTSKSRLLGCAAAVLFLVSALGGCEREPPMRGAPPQLRRLTEAQYRHTIADVFGSEIRVVGRFEPDLRVDGLLAVGTSVVSITPGGMEQYEVIARDIANQVVSPANRNRLVGCAPNAADNDGSKCARQFLGRVGARLYRRPLEPDELELAARNALQASTQLGDFHAGLASALAGLLTAPDFLFRIDHLKPGSAPIQLDAWSKAVRLSYFLWNTSPDEELRAAAQRGDLDRPDELAREADRMIASPQFTAGVHAFFEDFLQLDGLDTVAKDSLIYPLFSSGSSAEAREQTLRTITDFLVARRADYRDLFTTRRLAMNRKLGPLYDIPVPGVEWQMLEFPAGDPRAGLLTQVSFLALHSHPGRTSPTLRGKAIREILMCEKIPTPPANVNFTIVQDVTNPHLKTTRARVEAHLSDPECAGCHKLTDPMGLALEHFDGAGQFRADENGSLINTSGRLADATFNDAAGLGAVLSRDPAVASCLVQTVWRYASGRDVESGERRYLRYLQARFAADGYKLPELMRRIATSQAFYAVSPGDNSATATAKNQPAANEGS